MGRKAISSQQDVFAAADAMAAEGLEVTASALLTKLGGGSLTTIYKHLDNWRAANPAAAAAGMPIDIPDPVQGAFAAAWRVAATEAGREITAAKEKAAEEVKTAQKQFQEAFQSIERLEAEAEADGARIEELETKGSKLEESLHQSENERAALAATGDQQRQRIEAQDTELKRLREELEQQRKEQQTTTKEREKLIKEAAELRGQLQALESQNKNLLAKLGPSK